MAEKWLTVKEASVRLQRSAHTIYTWIERTRRGKADIPLKMRRSDKGNKTGLLISIKSLLSADSNSPRASRPRLTFRPIDLARRVDSSPSKFAGTHSCFAGGDTMKRVTADRRKWIKTWVDEGKTLDRVLSVFAPKLHQEIERLYRDEIKSRRRRNVT